MNNGNNSCRQLAKLIMSLLALSSLLMSGCTEENKAISESEKAGQMTPDKAVGVEVIRREHEGAGAPLRNLPISPDATDSNAQEKPSAQTGAALSPGSKFGEYSMEFPETKKINLNLLNAEKVARNKGASFSEIAASMGIATDNGSVVLDIVTNRLDASVEKKLRMTGIKIRHVSAKYNRVSAAISNPALLHQLAKIPEVRMIMPEYGGTTHGGVAGSTGRVEPKIPELIQ